MQNLINTFLDLSGAATDANGVWINVADMEFPIAVLVSAADGGNTIILNVTNALPLPANSVHDVQQASITAPGVTLINGPVIGLKARKPAATTSSKVTACLRVQR